MSEASYQDNVRRGVTGRDTATCLLASYDRFSYRTGISPRTYEEYELLRQYFVENVGDGNNFVQRDFRSRYTELKIRFRAELGVHSNRNIVQTRIDTKEGLISTIGSLTTGGFRTALFIHANGGLHAVGVKTLDTEEYEVKSTWEPFSTENPVLADSLLEFLYLGPRQRSREGNCRKTYPACNLVALPPEPKS